MTLKQARPTIIGSIYRPPDASYLDSITDLENLLNTADIPNHADMVLLGDMNIDLPSNNAASKNLNKFLKSLSLDQVITKPTRITKPEYYNN